MQDENTPVSQATPEDAFKALESAPVKNPNTQPNDQQGQGATQHMGQPPADGAPGSRNEGAPAQPATPTGQPPATPAAQQPINPEDWLAEASGGQYRKWEEVQAALNKPPVEKEVVREVTVVQPYEFKSDKAKMIAQAINDENYGVLAPFIEQHQFRARLDSMTPEQLVKANIKIQYPSFDDADVQAEYDKTYKPDELQLNAADYNRELKKANDRLARDAKAAKEDFLKIEPKLELPMQQAAQPAAPQPPQLSEEAKPIVAYGASFKEDKVSQFPFEYESQDKTTRVTGKAVLPPEAVTAVADKIKPNPEAFLAGFIGHRWTQDNGELDYNAIARDVALLNDPGLLINSTIKETYRQTYEEKLKRNRGYQPEIPRDDASGIMPTMADADKEKLRVFHGIPK